MDSSDTPAKPRAGIARRVVLIALGLIALNFSLVGGCFLTKWIPAGKVIERERARVEEGIAALRAERVIRPVFFEPEEEGNSWELLAAGLEAFDGLTPQERAVFPALREFEDVPEPAAEEAAKVVAKVDAYIENLKLALRRRWVDPYYWYEEGFNMQMPLVSKGLQACKFLGDRATALAKEGRSEEAVDTLIIGWGLSDHLAVKGCLVNELVRIAGGNVMADRLRRILADHSLSQKALERLALALARIDAARPDMIETYKRESLIGVAGVIQVADAGEARGTDVDVRGAAWRQWFSMRIVAAEYIEAQPAITASIETAARRPVKERLRLLDALTNQFVNEPKNVLIVLLMPALQRCWKTHAEDVRTVSLARLSVAVARFREGHGSYPAALTDLVPAYLPAIPKDEMSDAPFGFVVQDDSAGVYAWGEDGDDDGGLAIDEEDEGSDFADGDIVWTVKRAK